MQLLFVGGPLHMQVRDMALPLTSLEFVSNEVTYALERVDVECETGTRRCVVFVAPGVDVDDHPEAARYLSTTWNVSVMSEGAE